jgi:phosphoglycolate phosphatase-like HAD superfamily hydrolase
VVTSTLKQDALAELRATGLSEYIEVVVAFEDTDEHKPAATPQREALRRLSANAVVSVGDLPSDIASARAAVHMTKPTSGSGATVVRAWGVLGADSYTASRASDSKRRASTLSMRPYSIASSAVMK